MLFRRAEREFGVRAGLGERSVAQAGAGERTDEIVIEVEEAAEGVARVEAAAGAEVVVAPRGSAGEPGHAGVAETDEGVCAAGAVGGAGEEAEFAMPFAPGPVGEARVDRQHLNGAAHGVAAVERAGGTQDGLHLPGLCGFDESEVLVRSRAEGGVIETDAVDEVEHLIPGEAAEKGRNLGGGGLLHQHARFAFERVADGEQRTGAEAVFLPDQGEGGGFGGGFLAAERGGDGDGRVHRFRLWIFGWRGLSAEQRGIERKQESAKHSL